MKKAVLSLVPGSYWNARVWRIAVPIILANVTVPLPGIVDTAVMGQLPDPAYIGAVAIGAVIFSFVVWGLGFLRMSTSGFTAQAFGAGERVEIRSALFRPVILALLLGGLVVLFQAPLGALAFWAMAGSAEVESLASVYFNIRIWASPATLLNIVFIGWLLGLQRAGLTMVLQILLNSVNVALDLLFVLGLGWGVEGVALATVLAEIVTLLAGIILIVRVLKKEATPRAGRPYFDWPRILDPEKLVRMLRVNFDIFLRTFCLLFAFAIFTSEGGRMGDLTLAANAVLLQFFAFSAFALDGFAHAAEVLVGAELGAKNRGNFRAAVKATAFWANILAGAITLIYFLFGRDIIALLSTSEDVRTTAGSFLFWAAMQPLLGVWAFLFDGIFIGTTRSAALRNAMLVSIALYLAALWLLVPLLGNHGLWLAMSLFMVFRSVTLAACYPALERSIER